MKPKIVIYQLLPRLYGNLTTTGVIGGGIEQNGCGRFSDLTAEVISQLKDLGVTHLWLTGVIRHATGTDYAGEGLPASHPGILKGKAGSPYAINDYYDVDPDLALSVPDRFREFTELVDRIKASGLKVILDFVPNHLARDYASRAKPAGTRDIGEDDDPTVPFHPDNNYYYLPGTQLYLNGYREEPARATGNDVFNPKPQPHDWYETVKLNYGADYRTGLTYFSPVPDTWQKMTDMLSFWAGTGIDGFRCDMAGMVPVPFWAHSIGKIKRDHPGVIFIDELYEPERYEAYVETAGFDFLYDKAGFYDSAREVIAGRKRASEMTGLWRSLRGLDNKMVRFIENHDEQRVASREFAGESWPGLPALALAAFMNSGPVMLYAGQEFGEPADPASGCICADGRTTIFEYSFIPTIRNWLAGQLTEPEARHRQFTRLILNTLKDFPVLSDGQFYDLSFVNHDLDQGGTVCSFLRYYEVMREAREPAEYPGILLVAVCFDPAIHSARVRVPHHALEVMGISGQERIRTSSIQPFSENSQQLLSSQVVSSGIHIGFNPSGWAIIGIE
ncbi:MAG: alpha-amylase family glycosyl hydrolase [Bacteroidales bacterium]